MILKTTIVVCKINKLLCNECIFLMHLFQLLIITTKVPHTSHPFPAPSHPPTSHTLVLTKKALYQARLNHALKIKKCKTHLRNLRHFLRNFLSHSETRDLKSKVESHLEEDRGADAGFRNFKCLNRGGLQRRGCRETAKPCIEKDELAQWKNLEIFHVFYYVWYKYLNF